MEEFHLVKEKYKKEGKVHAPVSDIRKWYILRNRCSCQNNCISCSPESNEMVHSGIYIYIKLNNVNGGHIVYNI